ncbi:hypothetical protein YC2023_027989 [Brassica napus]
MTCLGDYNLVIFEDPSAMALVEAYRRANEDEFLVLNQMLMAENHSVSLLQAFDAWLQKNIEQFHTGTHTCAVHVLFLAFLHFTRVRLVTRLLVNTAESITYLIQVH